MPQNSNSIPLDDEDILDLTVVAEPGKPSGAAGGLPPRRDDFSEDLDALLDSLTQDGGSPAPAPSRSAPAEPLAAPIADQTLEDHDLDPDEQIAMPEMAEIDSLLAELGAFAQGEASPAVTDAPTPEVPAAEEAPAAPASPIADFDAILAQAQAADAAKAAEEMLAAPPPSADPFEAAKAAAPAVPADPFEAALAATPSVPSDPFEAAKAAAPAVPADPFEAALAEAAVPPAEDSQLAVVDEAIDANFDETNDSPDGHDGVDDLDLNELDALLDDILATAPEMSAPAQAKSEAAPAEPAPAAAASAEAAPAEPAPEAQASPSPAVVVSAASVVAPPPPVPQVAAVVKAPEKKVVVRTTSVVLTPVAPPAPVVVSGMPAASDASALLDRVRSLEEAVATLEATASPAPTPAAGPGGEVEERIHAVLAAMLVPGSPFMGTLVDALLAAVTAQDDAEGHAGRFREGLERMAAAAAAKVIREEITAIMDEE